MLCLWSPLYMYKGLQSLRVRLHGSSDPNLVHIPSTHCDWILMKGQYELSAIENVAPVLCGSYSTLFLAVEMPSS
jgi:hypothetical protein